MRLRRSALYVPGSSPRALAKAGGLDADVLIYDLEDAVLPEAKEASRAAIAEALAAPRGHHERVVRVNGLDTPWGEPDLAWAAGQPIDGVLLPKVNDAGSVRQAEAAVGCPLWCMIETPRGVLALESIAAASPRLTALVMGSNDLVHGLRALHEPSRAPLAYALSKLVLVARAYGLDALDGVHRAVADDEGFRATSLASRAMGFDGRTLIHPRAIEAANAIYGPSDEDVAHAERVVAAYEEAAARGQGVALLDGSLVEKLHADEAERIIRLARARSR